MGKDYDITSAMETIENELITSMIRNFGLHREAEKDQLFKWNMWQVEQLKALDIYKRRNAKRLKAEFKGLNKNVEDFIREAKNKGGFDEEIKILKAIKKGYKFRGTKQAMTADFFRVNEAKLNALIKATVNDMEKAEIAILRRSNDAYRKAIFNAQVYANTGAGTYKKAVDMATKDMLSAGLKCVTYANGSMHTLSDYAEMAIRTAAKRAYLQGAGEKRQEWGIATVIVNKRGGACPKCLPFVGKVMIDDVWSGGNKNDGGYPLMSTAISKGLYHPNCRDSHTTFFEGISKEESGYTKEELAQIGENYTNEQKEKYIKRQVEKYDRLSKNSLDEENKKKYKARKEEWQNRLKSIKNSTSNTKNKEKKYVVENSTKSDIIDVKEPKFVEIVPNEPVKGKGEKIDIVESELGKFKAKVQDIQYVEKDYYKLLKDKFSHASDDAKTVFNKFIPLDSVEKYDYINSAYYDRNAKKIHMNYKADMTNKGTTYFHEHGHMIDDLAGGVSKDIEFKKLLAHDMTNYRINYGKEKAIKTYDKVDKAISIELNNMHKHSAVSDIFEGITKGNIVGVAGHPEGYWDNEDNITAEAFAHMFEAEFDKTRYAELDKYFPTAHKWFKEKLKEMVK